MQGEFKIVRLAADLPLPKYMTEGSAGMDLYAAVDGPLRLAPGRILAVPTGIKISIPRDYEAQIRPRSGLALKGISMPNTPGTVDSDFRGEIKAILINLSGEDFVIERGMRVAQMVISRVERVSFVEAAELDETARGAGGFGHTGAG